jgi:hypothetical protein
MNVNGDLKLQKIRKLRNATGSECSEVNRPN